MRTKRNTIAILLVLLASSIGAGCKDKDAREAAKQGKDADRTEKRNDPPPPLVLAAGTAIGGTLQNSLWSDKSPIGQPVTLRVNQPVTVGGRTAIPVGSIVHGSVTHAQGAGRFKGASEITVRFHALELAGGMQHPASFEPVRWRVKGDGKETAAEISGGAAVGGIIGGVLGGADGAIKGGAAGAAVGTGVAAVTPGQQIHVPAGQGLAIRLTAPLSLTSLPG